MGKKDEPIDAGAELERLEAERLAEDDDVALDGERGPSRVGTGRRPLTPGAKTLMLLVLAIALAIGAAFTWKAMQLRQERDEKAAQAAAEADVVRNRLPALRPAPPQPEVAPTPALQASAPEPLKPVAGVGPTPANYQPSQPGQPPQKSPAELLRERRLSAAFGDGGQQGGAQMPSLPPGMPPGATPTGSNPLASLAGGGGGGGLADKLQPMKLTPAVATRITNPDYVLTIGTPLDCILQTKIVSTVPGLIECYFDRDIYSASGRVVLLDAQTKLVGRWEGGLMQGQARIFVAWGRAETPAPNHVVVNLDSPATGPLGEGGIGGYVDTHFWQRFGGAIMLSLIDDFAAAATQPSYGSNNQISFGNTSDAAKEMASKALENSINIPPTLEQLHGKRVQVMLARDLDFREVYELRAR